LDFLKIAEFYCIPLQFFLHCVTINILTRSKIIHNRHLFFYPQKCEIYAYPETFLKKPLFLPIRHLFLTHEYSKMSNSICFQNHEMLLLILAFLRALFQKKPIFCHCVTCFYDKKTPK